MHFGQITGTGKKAPVWKSTNFDAGLYDITGFLRTDIISIYVVLNISKVDVATGKWEDVQV
jgi:hypothetical protein